MPQYELSLRDYIRIIKKRRILIIGTFLVTLSASRLFVSKLPDVYQASTTVKISERRTVAGLLLTDVVDYHSGDQMISQANVVKGFPIMKKVALRLGLIKEDSSIEEVNAAVYEIEGGISVDPVESTDLLKITGTSNNPKKAMDLANVTAEVYIEEDLLGKNKQAINSRKFIEEQLAGVEKRLNENEEKLKEFGMLSQRAEIDPAIKSRLSDLQFQLASLLQKYTEKHPSIRKLREEINDLEGQLESRKGISSDEMEFTRVSREVEVNRKLYSMLKEKLEEAKITEAQKVADFSIVNPAVLPTGSVGGRQDSTVVIGGMLGLILGFGLAFVRETMDTSIGTVEDVESVLKLPVLGVIPSVEIGFVRRNFIIEEIIKFTKRKSKKDTFNREIYLIAHYKPLSPIAEAYRNIYTNLKLDLTKKTMLLTSSSPREGKSTVVCNLGIIMAQKGLKTLLVSADLRRPVLGKVFGLRREPGLNEVVMGTVKLENAYKNITDILLGDIGFEDIRKTPGIENISIITSGKLPDRPVELLESKEMANIIEEFKKRFDFIIFDSPPVLPVTDASLLAPKVDRVAIVYEVGRTSRQALIRSKIQLESVGAKISGIILNNTSPQAEAISSYPYYYRKYAYYGSEKKDDTRRKK